MNTSVPSFTTNYIVVALLGLVSAGVVVATLTGANANLPVISTDRAALITLGVLGFAMCAVGGINISLATTGFSHPITLIGALLGVLALVTVGAALFNVALPLIATERAAMIALAVLIVLKLALGVLRQYIT